MNRLGGALSLAFLAQALLSGCASRHPFSGTAELASLPAMPITVWAAEPDLAKKIVVCRQKVEKGPNGATMARVEIQNDSMQPLELEVQTLYKDVTGKTLNVSPWVRYTLKPGKKAWLMAPTLAPGTSRFFIQIQPAPPWKPLSGPTLPNFGLVPERHLHYALTSC